VPKRQDQKKPGLFYSVNYATVIASALAAGTSLTFANRIGIAGSLVGTVVAAAVSSISLQLYQRIINDSADKIRDAADAALTQPMDTDKTTVLADETKPLAVPETPIAPDELIQAAHQRENSYNHKHALIVSIAAALIALTLTSIAIYAITRGKGLGDKPIYVDPVAVQQQEHAAEPTENVNAPVEHPETSEVGTTEAPANDANGTQASTEQQNTTQTTTSTDASSSNATQSASSSQSSSQSSSTSPGTDATQSTGTQQGTGAQQGNSTTGGTSSGESASSEENTSSEAATTQAGAV
jgi:hypothetical protein